MHGKGDKEKEQRKNDGMEGGVRKKKTSKIIYKKSCTGMGMLG